MDFIPFWPYSRKELERMDAFLARIAEKLRSIFKR